MARSIEATRIARLRFRHLQLLWEMRDGGTIQQAAQATNVTQPAVTKSLQDIEDIFGCALFTRTRRGLMPTDQGAVLLRGTKLLLNDLDFVGQELAASSTGVAVLTRLGAPPFVAMSIVPGLLRKVVADQGEGSIRFQLHEMASPRLFDMLLDGELDALLTRFPAPTDVAGTSDADPLSFEKVQDDEMLVLLPESHQLARRRSIPMKLLAGEKWVLPTVESSTRNVLSTAFRLAGLLPVTPWMECSQPATMLGLVASGHGIALWPKIAAAFIHKSHHVVLTPTSPRMIAAPVGLFFRHSRADSPGIRALLHHIGKRSASHRHVATWSR